jgi:rhamnulokinase
LEQDSFFIAVDLGAGSGRVFLAGVAPGELLLDEVRRFHYPASHSTGHLRWDLTRIFAEIKAGLREAGARARRLGRPVSSVGVDSWGVDYGLVDDQNQLVEQPICYRDERTAGVMDQVFAGVPRAEVFAHTGIQFMALNTLYQFRAHTAAGLPANAARLLLIPDLINLFLTGKAVTEYTNATTTQMVNAETGKWDAELLQRLGLPGNLLAEIVPAGTDLGPINSPLAAELDLAGVHVIAPATHDTGSAVAGAPLPDRWAYISSGTWSLVGIERDRPLINADVARQNFTNEGGAFGTIRFLKNVMGLWILESCRKEWKERGLDVDYVALLRDVAALERETAFIYPDDPRFFNPPSMLEALAQQLADTGQAAPSDPPAIAKVILDSLAFRYASIVRTIESLTGERVKGMQIVGGGSQNEYLNQMTADATGLPVLAGPVEATAIGNVLVQGVAGGRFASLREARRHVGENLCLKKFAPRLSDGAAAQRYALVEARYTT